MKYAVLRGVIVYLAVAALAFFAIQFTILFDRGRWFEDFEQWFLMPILCGLGPAIAAYASHPLAKGLPKPWQERIHRWFDYWGVRALIGVASGSAVAWSFFLAAVALTSVFGLADWSTTRWRAALLQPQWTIEIVSVSMIVTAAACAWSTSILAAIVCPSWVKIQDIWKFASKRAVAGLIVGAWLGAGLGMAFCIVVDSGYLSRSDEQSVGLLAGCCGNLGGILVAGILRVYFKC